VTRLPDPLARRRGVVFVTLLVGYASFYLCRANVNAAVPLLAASGYSKTSLGNVLSAAVACYAVGKFVMGAIGDVIGGRRLMLAAIAGSVVATVGIGLSSGLVMFAAFAMVNRFFQAGGWAGLVHVVSRWFPAARSGAVMGALSTSYELGNVGALTLCGWLAGLGYGWRPLFVVNPALMAIVGVGIFFVLRGEPPRDDGAPNAPSDKAPLREALPFLAKQPAFWATVVLSMLLTFTRDAFLSWTPSFLAELARANGDTSVSGAIFKSAIFPASGVVAAITVGFISDRFGTGKRAPVIVVSLALHVVAVLVLAHAGVRSVNIAAFLVGVCGLFLLGPYSLLAGALTLDVAGKRAAATAAGIIDGAGYAAATLVGVVLGRVADKWGWPAVFDVISATGGGALLVAAGWALRTAPRSAEAPPAGGR
jgi:sugar phosphate permease